MKSIYDDLAQREAEAEKLRQTIKNTPPNDPAYVCTCKSHNYSRPIWNIPPLFPAYNAPIMLTSRKHS